MTSTKAKQEFADLALTKVREKLASDKLHCQLCGVFDWNAESHPAFVPLWDVDSEKVPILSGSQMTGLPLVTLTCKNCGNTLFINAMVLGLGELIESSQRKHD